VRLLGEDADERVAHDALPGAHVPAQSQMHLRKLSMMAVPCGVWTTSAWNIKPTWPRSSRVAATAGTAPGAVAARPCATAA
jgi:hypothetical protein